MDGVSLSLGLRPLPGLTVAKQPDNSGHVRVVLVLPLDEDVLAGVDDDGPWQTIHADVQGAETQGKRKKKTMKSRSHVRNFTIKAW